MNRTGSTQPTVVLLLALIGFALVVPSGASAQTLLTAEELWSDGDPTDPEGLLAKLSENHIDTDGHGVSSSVPSGEAVFSWYGAAHRAAAGPRTHCPWRTWLMTPRLQDLSLRDRNRRAVMHYSRGMYSLARDELQTILGSARDRKPEQEGELRCRLATCCAALGYTEEADRTVEEALRIPGLPVHFGERLQAVRGFSALSRGDYPLAREILQKSVEAQHSHSDSEGLTASLRWLATTYLRLGELEPAFEHAYWALAVARQGDLESEAGHAHGVLCVAFIQRGQYESATSHGREALGIASRLGHQSAIIRHCIHLSIAALYSGEFELASNHALRALASAEEFDAPNLQISARLAAGRALRESGRLESARELVEGALEIAKSSERERDHVLVLEDLGDLDMLGGNVRAGLEKFRLAWRRAEKIAAEGDLVSELGWRVGLALLELGDAEGAIPWIERSIEVSEKSGERKEHALALRARGLWNAGTGSEEAARADLEQSLSILEALKVPYEQARTHLAFHRALGECASDVEGSRAERQQHLSSARRIFERTGSIHGLKATDEAELALVAYPERAPVSTASRRRRPRLVSDDWASASFQETLEECAKLGPTSLPLLLIGPTGAGKTLLAETLHYLGRGDQGEFFPVNCAAMPEHLQESELFGHRKGSFTGAEREHAGIFREAGRGTVFLDEIDKTSLEFQAKLLQVLDSREVRPVGTTRLVTINARIVCATNRDLLRIVEEGKFLEDLYHRLTCGIIEIPALADRIEDLRILSKQLLEEVCELERTVTPEITEDAWMILKSHDWPGNVRELKSLLHRAVALNRAAPVLDAEAVLSSAPRGSSLRVRSSSTGAANGGLAERMAHVEREEILYALEKADGVRRRAAEILGISYRGLGKKMARLGIDQDRRSA